MTDAARNTRLLYGFHAALSKLRRDAQAVRELYLAEQRQDARARDALALAQQHGIRVFHVDAARLDQLTGHSRHQGIALRIDANVRQQQLSDLLDTLPDFAEPPLLLVLDGIQDPHNLGACLRTADAAGAHAVIAPKDRAVGLTAAAVKVACGAADSVPYIPVTNLARALRQMQEAGIFLYGAAGEAEQSLYELDLSGPVAWVLGAEAQGLRRLTRDTCDVLARIPMYGSVESLNVSVATGICLFETCRQRAAARA